MGIQALENRVHRLEHVLKSGPRSWHLSLETDEEIPPAVLALIQEGDSVIIREYPPGLLGPNGSDSPVGHVSDAKGTRSVWRDGRVEPIGR